MTSYAVACPEPIAATVASRALKAGGNAIDAATSGAFAQAVTNPLGTGIAGMAHIMLLLPGDAAPTYLNASVEVGSAATPSMFAADFIGRSERAGRYLTRRDRNQYGYESIMTPGFVRGMEALLSVGRGQLPWTDLVQPAAETASQGFEVYPYLEDYFTFEGPSRPGYPNIFDKLAKDRIARDLFLPGGGAMRTGERLRQEAYGDALSRIATHGADDFYTGETAELIAGDISRHGGSVTAEDLRSYSVRAEEPVVGQFEDLRVYTAPPPSHGIILLTMLGLVDRAALTAVEWNGPDYVELIAWATRTAFAECLPYLGDPGYVTVPFEWLTSPERLSALARGRRERSRSSASAVLSDHTTQISTGETTGRLVSITHSIGSVTGAGVMTPKLGFFYNNFIGHFNVLPGYHDSIATGKRMGGGCPSIVFRAGKPWMAIGSSGGPRLISAVFQTLINVHVMGMTLQDAIAAPRIHCEEELRLYIEPTFSIDTRRTLSERGYELVETSYMGCNQAVAIERGQMVTGTDPRGGMGSVVRSDELQTGEYVNEDR